MRLFVALDIPEELKEELRLLKEVLSSSKSLRFVNPDNIHLTLKFIGEVSDEKLWKVKEDLSAVEFKEVKLSTTKLGTFTGVLWLGVRMNSDLARLRQEVQRALRQFAMNDPRPFKPHLTIARFRELEGEERELIDRIVKEGGIEFDWKADSFTLFRSTLTPQGPVYEALATFPSKKN